jgi:hypothetical protein
MVQLFAAVTLYVASQLVIPKLSLHFVNDSVRKLLDTSLYLLFRLLPDSPLSGVYNKTKR